MKLTLMRKKSSYGELGPFVALVERQDTHPTWYEIGVWIHLDAECARRTLDGTVARVGWGLSEWDEHDHYHIDWLEPVSWLSLLITTGISKDKLHRLIEDAQNEVQIAREKSKDKVNRLFTRDQED